MKANERIILFSKLGQYIIDNLESEEFQNLYQVAKQQNGWFTNDNIRKSLISISVNFLNTDKLTEFKNKYSDNCFSPSTQKQIGIVAAGNIPLVGFQDLLHVVLSGHVAHYKPSSQDQVLPLYLVKKLGEINPTISNYIVIADKLNNLDAYIATGSGNTSRYFEHYFGNKPNIIRKNRVSIAVLNGEESNMQLSDLGNDIFSYFGLGCRNVSKLFVPQDYDFTSFFQNIEYWSGITLHSKYVNNYDYNKSIMLVNREKHLDNGFLLVKETNATHSPISTVFYEEYATLEELQTRISSEQDSLQCVVSTALPGCTAFGESQSPQLWDYADGVDTIEFLNNL